MRNSGHKGPSGRKDATKRPAPVSVRLNDQERQALLKRAGSVPLSTYLKTAALGRNAPTFRKAPQMASVERELAAKILAALGASRIASNLSQLAKHANLGNVYFDEDTKADIRLARELVSEVRDLLLRALGKEPRGETPERLSKVFRAAARVESGK